MVLVVNVILMMNVILVANVIPVANMLHGIKDYMADVFSCKY
jgi:hypothetical protein